MLIQSAESFGAHGERLRRLSFNIALGGADPPARIGARMLLVERNR
jgi:hypothetical protein